MWRHPSWSHPQHWSGEQLFRYSTLERHLRVFQLLLDEAAQVRLLGERKAGVEDEKRRLRRAATAAVSSSRKPRGSDLGEAHRDRALGEVLARLRNKLVRKAARIRFLHRQQSVRLCACCRHVGMSRACRLTWRPGLSGLGYQTLDDGQGSAVPSSAECCICQEVKEEQVVTQCCHTYCMSCIKLYRKSCSGAWKCALCNDPLHWDDLIMVRIV